MNSKQITTFLSINHIEPYFAYSEGLESIQIHFTFHGAAAKAVINLKSLEDEHGGIFSYVETKSSLFDSFQEALADYWTDISLHASQWLTETQSEL